MQLIAQTLFKSTRSILDADVSQLMTAVLQKGNGENVVTINNVDVFTVNPHMYMLRIVGTELVLYDGQEIYFYTTDGKCKQQVTVGHHVFDLLPMEDAVTITYRDEGVYDDPIGKETIVVVKNDGTMISQLAFAEQHGLQYDIRFAKVKPFACLSSEQNKIIHFNQQFDCLKTENCPFDVGSLFVDGTKSYHNLTSCFHHRRMRLEMRRYNMEQTSFYTYIKLAGDDDFPLDEVTKRLDVEPTTTWRVGDKVHPNKLLERFYTCWKYKIGPVDSLDVDDVFNPLYDLFNPKVDIINELKEQYDLSVNIALVIEMENGRTPASLFHQHLAVLQVASTR